MFIYIYIFYEKTRRGDYGPLGTTTFFLEDEDRDSSEDYQINLVKYGIIIETQGNSLKEDINVLIEKSFPIEKYLSEKIK